VRSGCKGLLEGRDAQSDGTGDADAVEVGTDVISVSCVSYDGEQKRAWKVYFGPNLDW
jgi:hypothetical protein